MKKLMFAATVAAAMAGFAVESQVVGYNTKGLTDAGQLITGSFLTINSTDSFKLSEIKLDGYQNNSFLKDEAYGTWGYDFSFNLLNEFGETIMDATYGWYDLWDGENWSGGYWTIDGSGEPVEGDNDLTLKAGESIWFLSMAAGDGEKFTFQSAGAVSANDISFKLRDAGNAVGNPMPATIKLSEITLTGYQNNSFLKDEAYGTWGYDFSFNLLNEFGETIMDATYGWYDLWDGENWAGGYWTIDGTGEPVEGDTDLELAPGQAVWFLSMAAGEDEEFILEFPTPLNND